MEVIEIKKENALKAYKEAPTEIQKVLTNLLGPELFIKPETSTLVKLELSGKKEDADKYFEYACKKKGIDPIEVIPHKNPKTNYEFYDNARIKLEIITEVANDGWVHNTANTTEYKYWPWFKITPDSSEPSGFGFSFGDFTNSFTSADFAFRLAFSTKEKAIAAGKQFIDLYRDYYTR